MMRVFAVHVSIRKGLGPDWAQKVIDVGFDDLPEDMTDAEIREMAKRDAEDQLRRSEDYPLYGKNWIVDDIIES